MFLIYRLLISFYFKLIHFLSFFHGNAKKWVEGRHETRDLFTKRPENKKAIWFHAASLGEFEQGRTLIELVRLKYPDERIILSFFSPSGYTIRKNYSQVNEVIYFLSDMDKDIDAMMKYIDPKIVIFIKYEFWFNTLNHLRRAKIPYIYISSIFRKGQYFFLPGMSYFKDLLKDSKRIFLQEKNSMELLQKHDFHNIQIAGDARIDRVMNLASQAFQDEAIQFFVEKSPVLIIGSLWLEDLKIIKDDILKLTLQGWKLIIAPHDIDKDNIKEVKGTLNMDIQLYTDVKENQPQAQILLINVIGILSSIYRYANLVYIGGGFGKGIHNTLEPLAYRKTVCFGPKFKKFPEAKYVIENKLGIIIHRSGMLYDYAISLNDAKFSEIESGIKEYLEKNKNASHKIFEYLQSEKLLS